MPRIARIEGSNADTWPQGLMDALRVAQRVYHSWPAHLSYSWMADEGIRVCPLEDASPLGDDDWLVVVQPQDALSQLVQVVDRLLGPRGCPWDREQTHATLRRYLIEECYELVDAVDSGDQAALIEELGDVLLQPIMHAQMAARDGSFSTETVAQAIVAKLIRRHPHVFSGSGASTPDEVLAQWDRLKKAEKEQARSILDGIPRSAPSLLRALEVSKRAARAGFEWPHAQAVREKLDEELRELEEARRSEDQDRYAAELGDVLFTLVNLARWHKVDPEMALRTMVDRFTARFTWMEAQANAPLHELDAERWDELWTGAKSVCG